MRDKEEDRLELEEFCVQHAMAFHLNDKQWIPLEELVNQAPKTGYLNVNYFHPTILPTSRIPRHII